MSDLGEKEVNERIIRYPKVDTGLTAELATVSGLPLLKLILKEKLEVI